MMVGWGERGRLRRMDALARVLHRYGADPIEEELWVTETHDWEGKPVRVVGRSEEESLSKIKPALLQKAKAMQQEALETTGEEYDVVSGEDLGRVFHWAHYATEEEALTSSSGPWERLHQVTYRVSLTEGAVWLDELLPPSAARTLEPRSLEHLR